MMFLDPVVQKTDTTQHLNRHRFCHCNLTLTSLPSQHNMPKGPTQGHLYSDLSSVAVLTLSDGPVHWSSALAHKICSSRSSSLSCLGSVQEPCCCFHNSVAHLQVSGGYFDSKANRYAHIHAQTTITLGKQS